MEVVVVDPNPNSRPNPYPYPGACLGWVGSCRVWSSRVPYGGASSGGRSFALTADCFNVFNDRSVTSVNTIYGDDDGEGVYLNSDGEPLFGQPLSYQSPRTFRVGLRGEF